MLAWVVNDQIVGLTLRAPIIPRGRFASESCS
jgi:hypothetical protein